MSVHNVRRCLDCGRLSGQARCLPCRRAQHRRMYSGGWVRTSRLQRAAEPWCAECGATEDLTTDHVDPGSLEAGVRTLCRRCNSAKGAEKFGVDST